MVNLQQAKDILQKHYEKQFEVAKNHCTEREFDRVKQKYKHSYEVLEMGRELIKEDEILSTYDEEIKEIMGIVCILHDIARFYEIGEGIGGVSHGTYGAYEILKIKENINNPLILLPIKYHDGFNFDGLEEEIENLGLSNQKDLIFTISKFIKDADKMANFKYFKRIKYVSHTRQRQLYVANKVMEQFKNFKLVNKEFCETVFDIAINFLSWEFDLNFDASKRIFIREEINKYLLANFRDMIELITDEQSTVLSPEILSKKKEELYNIIKEIGNILKNKKLM
jgi:hypothetical protein